ncbi:hybrid sensor histidine kinase/response regulator [Polyangium aurulentum]|uniref:hybrid sensor histidine kinase/response regulator n=1 Tax=Polyangium aurulentum TaxID=2567896 RepID=UPI0010ADB73E|nr:ATP-binding protein [Polyangium aurulentum]UQA61006.1 response regulator [Polyangium aurulentum]
MACLLTLDLDKEALGVLRDSAASWNIAIEDADSLQYLEEHAADVLAVVVGAVSEPIRVAQRVRMAAPDIPVVLVRSPDDCALVNERLRITPLIGNDVRCLPGRPLPAVVETIGSTIDRARRRRSFRQTIGSLNRKLASGVGTGRGAAGMLGRLLEVAPIGVIVTDSDMSVRAVNPRGASLLGQGEADLIGRPLPEVFAPGASARLASMLRGVDENAGARKPEVFEAGARGEARIEVTGVPLPMDAGGPGYLVLLQDVTERYQLVEQLRAANRRKDEFLAMLGHELRNPLMPILTALELMRMRGQDVFAKERAVLQRQANHLLRLVEDLMDVSRITRGKVELKKRTVELSRVVARAVETASPLLEQRSHELAMNVPTTGLLVHADEDRLVQVVANLLSNAAKYTPPRGKIEVEGRRAGEEIALTIRDSGMGISPELLPEIFNLFVQGERTLARSEGGLGLGLAIVKIFVELHGGTVSAWSEGPGKGSEFTIRLPSASEPPQSAAETRRSRIAAARPEGSAKRVLIVDDNVDAAALLEEALVELGYVVRVAHDGPAALAIVVDFAPDVGLFDIGLPVMDGYELASRVRELCGDKVSLVAVTGYGQPDDVKRAFQASFDHHVTKPVDLQKLLGLIERARPNSAKE